MAKRNRKSHPTWTDVQAKLGSFDRAGLLGLVQNLYTAQADTRTFLHARFGLTEDVLLTLQEIDRAVALSRRIRKGRHRFPRQRRPFLTTRKRLISQKD
jgi:hypothetical protein